ncbi:MAG: asparaginase [Selenomonadaceae bacterium]|nr:asparaginase [Selenomonadaceae bacterium]
MAQKKKICVIATGGTIASVPGPGGLRPGLPGERLLELAPGVAELADVDCVNLMALDSSNLLPEHWQKMAKAIAERRENYDGFVVTHGTDTMAYSAGALFLMLENIDRPVILTGAQLPMDAPGTDAARNVLAALHAALSGRPGVYLAFAGNLHAGGAVRKLYSRQLAGFGSIDRPVAAIFKDGCYEWQWQQPKTDGAFRLATDLDDHIAVLKLVPGTDPALLKLMVDAGYHAIIIEGYGAGGVPNSDSPKDFLPALSYAAEKNVRIICTTQCVYDGTYLDTYEIGIMAMQKGAISAGRLHPELLVPAVMLALAQRHDRAALEIYLRNVEEKLFRSEGRRCTKSPLPWNVSRETIDEPCG